MGAYGSHALSGPFDNPTLCSYGQAEAAATLARYKELDLDFGIDQAALELLLKLDKGEGDDMVSVLDAGTRTVNALDLVCGLALCVPGTVDEKTKLCFKAYDFAGAGLISKDELTILFMSAYNGAALISGKREEINEERPTALADRAFKALDRDGSQSISEEELVKFVRDLLGSDGADDVLSDTFFDAI